MLTSLFGSSPSGKSLRNLWQSIMQSGRRRAQQARRRATPSQVSTSHIELLETRVLLTDFGDAPLPYPTLTAENGAQHAEVGLTLGTNRDGEANGVHSTNANGDDTAGTPDDEDGVTFPATIRDGDLSVQITVNVQGITTTGKLDAWIDFNGDGNWGGQGEQIASSETMVNGNNTVTFDVPAGAKAGTTYARFRLSSAGGLGPKGAAADGEVEDYPVTIVSPIVSTANFGTANVVTTGADGAQGAFAADIDGDGDMDLLSASEFDDKVAWYQNDGTPLNGGWSNNSISTTADKAEMVVAIDLDGDGDLDVLSASANDNKIAWYENDGTPAVGAWTARTISTAVFSANSIFAVDMEGDGDIDIVATSTNNFVYWLDNDGNQTFTLKTVTSSAQQAIFVQAADMDLDGDMDIVSASVLDDKVAWYENDGSQNFTARTVAITSDEPNSVYLADIDRDGDMDIAAASFRDNKIVWFENDGTPANGGWVTHAVTTNATGTVYVYGADLDGDGDMDLLSADSGGHRVVWYTNDGSQNFTSHIIATGLSSAQVVLAADVDQDGDLDVVSASYVDDKIAWFENQNDTTPPTTTSIVRQTPSTSPTNLDSLTFRVTFSEGVTGVAAADFLATGTTASISVASVSALVYDVTLTGGNLATLNGTVGLNFATSPTIADLYGNALPNTEPTTDETYVVDNAAPSTTSFVRQTPTGSLTNVDTLVFRVTFSEAVTGVAAADFAASGTNATLSVASVSALIYDVTLTGGNLPTLNGTVGLNFAASPTITDLAGNSLPSTEPATDDTFALDNAAPSATSFVRQTPTGNATNADSIVFRVTFSEDVTGVAAADFAASGTSANLSVAAVSASVYDITLTGGDLGTLNGTVGLNFATSPTIADLAGNAMPKVEPATDDTFTVDNTAPSTTSFMRQVPTGSSTNADTLVFRVTFSEAVTGVGAIDFVASGTTATLSVASVSASIYDITLSGGDLAGLNGTVGLNFNSPAITDLAGNALPSTEPGTDQTFTIDNTAPSTTSFARQTPGSSPTNVNTLVFRVTFNEAVTGVEATDFLANGTTAGLSVAVVSSTVYDVTLTGGDLTNLNGTVGLNFAASPTISNLAGIGLPNTEPATDETFVVDNAAPSTTSFVRQTPSTSPTNVDSLVFRVTFNEAVTGVAAADFAASGTNATISVATVSTTVYDVTLTGGNLAGLNGTVGLNFVTSPTINDLAGNVLPNTEPLTDETFVVDNAAPSVTVTPTGTITNAGAITFTFQFSETVTGFDASDITVANGTKGTFTPVDGDTYTLVVTPVADGTVSAGVGANAATDTAANANTAGSASITSDRTAPGLTITPNGTLTNAATTTFTFQFTEAVTGFTVADVTVTNGSKGTFTPVDADTYTLVVTPSADGAVTVAVSANAANDTATNGNSAASATITSDRTAPGVTITPDVLLTNAASTTFTFQFTETVTGFAATDITLTNGTKGTFTPVDGDTYTLVVTPVADGAVSVSVSANSAADAATNGNTTASASITSDRTAPGLNITPNGTITNASAMTFTFQFTEGVTGFDATDIAVTNGTKGTFTAVDGDTYTLVVTPVADGTVSVTVNANVAADAATNGNTSATASITSDRTVTVLDITPNGTVTKASSTTFTFQFSSPVTGFDVNDVTVTNGTKGTFTTVDSDTYTLVVTPLADGAVTVSVSANAALDAATNGNTAASASITSDRTAPGLTITPNGTLTNAASTTFTFQFTSTVTGFDASDISVSNGTKGTFTAVDGDTYTLVVTPVADGVISVNVNANAAIDAATNGNTAASASITSDRTAPGLSITPDGILTNAAAITFTFQFTSTVTGFDASDINVSNGTKGTFTAVDGDTYTLVVVPVTDGAVTVSVTANAAIDAATNGNMAASASITSNRAAPSLTIAPNGALTNAPSTTFTFQFSESVTGFDAGDIGVTNGTQGIFTAVDGDTYTLIVAPAADGVVSVTVGADAAINAAGTGNTSAAASITSDRTAPTLVITPDGTLSNAATMMFTFQFTELVTGFDITDINVTNGSKGTFTALDGDTYTLIVMPTADGTVSVDVNVNAAIDAATNGNTDATASFVSDRSGPVFTSAASSSIPENSTAITNVAATDSHGPVTLSIEGGVDSNKFTIDTNTGTLQFIAPPDFENPTDGNLGNDYNVQIGATDSLGQMSLLDISVTVSPLNDNLPIFGSLAAFSVDENVTAVGTVSAADADQPNQAVTFSITGGADELLFSITSGGVLTFKAAPDFEAPSDADANHVYELQVTADDGAGGTAVQNISVTVQPVNDNSPVFTSPTTYQIDENATSVGTVSTTDADTPSQTVTYTITGGAESTQFAITSGGVLTFNVAPDYEVPGDADGNRVYEVEVTANDGAGRTTIQTISISIAPTNDNAPDFTSSATLSVAENGTSVGSVTATDADSPDQTVTYLITGGADALLFSLSTEGLLQFITAPDFEVPADADGDIVYELQVTANDGNGLTSTQSITVTVTDFGESPQLVLGDSDVVWIKKHPAASVLPDVQVFGNGSLAGGVLTINMDAVGSKKKSKDLLGHASFMTFGSGPDLKYANQHLSLEIQLGANVTAAAVESFLRSITFSTKGKGLKTLTRIVDVELSNVRGQSSSVSQTVHVRKK